MSQFDILDQVKTASQKKPKLKTREANKSTVSPPSRAMKPKGRSPGKSNDDRYFQIGPYIKRTTYIEIKKRLIDDHKNRDLSDLVEELLSQWISQ